MIFNSSVYNETPKEFVGFLDGTGLKKGKIKMGFYTNGYLEADEDAVNGYVVSLERH